jgi:hypothetical protein
VEKQPTGEVEGTQSINPPPISSSGTEQYEHHRSCCSMKACSICRCSCSTSTISRHNSTRRAIGFPQYVSAQLVCTERSVEIPDIPNRFHGFPQSLEKLGGLSVIKLLRFVPNPYHDSSTILASQGTQSRY